MSHTKTYKSVCRSCHGGCGVILSLKDGLLVNVTPDRKSPFSRGYMCVKCLNIKEMVYHPDRILSPLKRAWDKEATGRSFRGIEQEIGGKGNKEYPNWQKISWDQALSEIAEKLESIRKESGPESIAIGQGTGRHHYMDVVRFANALGTPNWYEPGLSNCFIPRITVSNLTYGRFISPDYYGETTPRTIIFWGHNPLVSSPDGEVAPLALKALEKGAYGIAVDPRRSETAKKCRMWLPLRPGTDCALALAMIHFIINENLYDHDFVENHTTGFQELKAHIQTFSPSWASDVTGIPVKLITDASRQYAVEKPSVLDWGLAIEQTPNSLQTVRAIAILRGITGNIDAPGSDTFGASLLKPYPVLRAALSKDAVKKRLGASEFKLLGGPRAFMPSAHIPAVMKAMQYGEPYKIRALLNFGSNPLTTIANAKKVHDAISSLELLVVSDMFMTPTASMADYILPAAFWPEVNQLVEIPYVTANAVMAQQKVISVGECRQDEEILRELALRLDLPGSEESLEDIMNYRLSDLGITFDELKNGNSSSSAAAATDDDYGNTFFPKLEYYKYRKNKNRFHTPSGKVELYSKSLERMGYEPLPIYREPPESPIATKKLYEKYPLILTTGSRRKEYFHSDNRQIETLRKRRPHPVADINTKDAKLYGIKNGENIEISSPRGTITMCAFVTEDIAQGVVNIDHGWWFPEKADSDFGIWESNANILTSDAPPYDKAFGTYQLRALLCAIAPI
ncbi:Similar to molybdopterin oxidoreductase, molybdopterin-containing subunit [Desulfamplus magnetovallimortis]|uniref:Similar to molybdopterin oxidoreductase, molybdopterin-containing subunit n=1 Tax=Desulfamplus magnetovallimortis TaxID=1246637 RepID=A0A1W1HD55_9BACT|nr:molybdopterin-dependent oxidoreductase [Desulfamplus magnetovallimortis]SLM30410.1 Similar to molybdopterin oxidoreductase, molybdopterin-containing subunit [Desulfamplus magnetovallimortis]